MKFTFTFYSNSVCYLNVAARENAFIDVCRNVDANRPKFGAANCQFLYVLGVHDVG
jgi:hypothetical protein